MEQGNSNQGSTNEEAKAYLSPVATALFIGFLIGIVVYSVAVNTWGVLTLIPLFLVYLLLKRK